MRYTRGTRSIAIVALLLFGLGACSEDAAPEPNAEASINTDPSPAATWTYVAIGDSIPAGMGEASGVSYVNRYAHFLQQDTGHDLAIANLAENGATTTDVLKLLKTDDAIELLEQAHVVTLTIGANDIFEGNDDLLAGSCNGARCYDEELRSFGRNFEKIVGKIASLTGQDAVMRVTTYYNPAIGDPAAETTGGPDYPEVLTEVTKAQARLICDPAEAVGFICVDLLSAFNGSDGLGSAYDEGLIGSDRIHPTTDGHQLIATLLRETGYAPLQ